jgi:IS30 family transposase
MGTRYKHLSLEERYTIARLYTDGQSIRKIAAGLDRTASSVSREINRNAGVKVGYKPVYADDRAWARRWRGSKLVRQPDLRRYVLDRLAMGWSPEQVAGRLTLENSILRISHESIYRFIYSQLARTKDYTWRHYLPRAKSKRGWGRQPILPARHIKYRVSITDRPTDVDDRTKIGHWETDLLHPRKSGAAVLVAIERSSRYVLLAKQAGKQATPIADQLISWFDPMPDSARQSLTQDNGPEFAQHYRLNTFGIKTYFCHPHHPWQKGSVENMNGRIRRYIPLGTDPNSFSNANLQSLAQHLNNTPRKCLGFKTPSEVFLPQIKPLRFKCESTFRPPPE